MRDIKVYTLPERAAFVARFIDDLNPRLWDRLTRQKLILPHTAPRAEEAHCKHFTLERYRNLYKLRERAVCWCGSFLRSG